MLSRMLPACVLAAALLAANGCCCSRPLVSRNGGFSDCGTASCGEGESGPIDRFMVNHTRKLLTCGSGCGDIYWGEWSSDPPACGNPCDTCGDWAGESCCGAPWHVLSGLRHLWGYRYRAGGCGAPDCEGGCASCAAQLPDTGPMEPIEAGGVKSVEKIVPPAPEPEPAPAKKAGSASYRMRSATYKKPSAAKTPRYRDEVIEATSGRVSEARVSRAQSARDL